MPRGGLSWATVITILLGAWAPSPAWTGTASAAIYWTNSDPTSGAEEIGRANLDGSNTDPGFIKLPKSQKHGAQTCDGVTVDGTDIYWAENGLDAIGRANIDGSNANPEFITGAERPCGIATDSSHIYWINDVYPPGPWSIGRANLDGTEVQPEFLKTAYGPCGLANSGPYLFGSSLNPEGPALGIDRTASDGSGAPELFIPHVETGCGIAVSGEYLYWTDFEGFIGRASLHGTLVEPQFISGLDRPCGVAVNEGEIYWTEEPGIGDHGAVSRADINGSAVQHAIISGLVDPCGIAVDNTVAPPPPTKPEVVDQLTLGPVKHSRSGTVFVAINVTTPGSLQVKLPRAIRWTLLGGSTEVGAGRHWLKLTIGRGSARAWPRRALRRWGDAKFSLIVGFLSAEGPSRLVTRSISISRPRIKHSNPDS